MALHLDIERAEKLPHTPDDHQFQQWLEAVIDALQLTENDQEVSLLLTSSEQIRELNVQYRNKDSATNVLSFPADIPEELGIPLLGDIIICAEIVEKEAAEQQKTVISHWAHMTIHGMLHLLGYDHIIDNEAEEMEALETRIMQQLGFPAPYALTETTDSQ